MRGGLPVRVRAAWLPPGGGVRPRGRARPPRGRRGVAPRVRARGLRRGRGVHLLRPPREAAGHRQGRHTRAAQQAGTVDRRATVAAIDSACLLSGSTVARDTGTLLAGNLCNTNVYEPGSAAERTVRSAFAEQVAWAAEAGVDFIIAETFSWAGEALLALETIRAA